MQAQTLRTNFNGVQLRAAKTARRATRAKAGKVVAFVSNPAEEHARAIERMKDVQLMAALKTPFLYNGHIDLEAYDMQIQRLVDGGVDAVLVGGTTGEGQLMSWDEHLMLIAHTVHNWEDDVVVVGNTGSNNTNEAVHASEQGFEVGMHAALHINPYYGKTSHVGLVQHFKECLRWGPSIIYNVAGRTGQDIPDDVILQLKDHPYFLGVKECSGNERIANYYEQGVRCWSGNDDQFHEGIHKYNCSGVISVATNLVPGLWSKLCTEYDPELNKKLEDLTAWLFCEPNPIALNTAMAMCGLCKPVFRLPYVPLTREQREIGAPLLRAVQEHIPGCTEVRVMEDEEFKLISRLMH